MTRPIPKDINLLLQVLNTVVAVVKVLTSHLMLMTWGGLTLTSAFVSWREDKKVRAAADMFLRMNVFLYQVGRLGCKGFI
jgi:hypothetical protein